MALLKKQKLDVNVYEENSYWAKNSLSLREHITSIDWSNLT